MTDLDDALNLLSQNRRRMLAYEAATDDPPVVLLEHAGQSMLIVPLPPVVEQDSVGIYVQFYRDGEALDGVEFELAPPLPLTTGETLD